MRPLLPLLVIGLGAVLLVFMVVTEDEPGALPLLLLLVGTIWYFVARSRARTPRP